MQADRMNEQAKHTTNYSTPKVLRNWPLNYRLQRRLHRVTRRRRIPSHHDL